jgi:hypothetical protein
VANGGLAWYVDNPISARVSKHHYGVEVSIPFDPNVPDMIGRVPFRNKHGEVRVENAWHTIVPKVNSVNSDRSVCLITFRMRSSKPDKKYITHIASLGVKISHSSSIPPNCIFIGAIHLRCSSALLVCDHFVSLGIRFPEHDGRIPFSL